MMIALQRWKPSGKGAKHSLEERRPRRDTITLIRQGHITSQLIGSRARLLSLETVIPAGAPRSGHRAGIHLERCALQLDSR